MKLILTHFLILFTGLVHAGQIEWGLRVQFNGFRYLSDPAAGLRSSYNSFSPGFNLQIKSSATTFIKAAVLLQKRNYRLDYKLGNATFTNANLNLTEFELGFGKYLFSKGRDCGFYLNGGIQALYRNWGEEVYKQEIISNTYWPELRVSSMIGAGYSILTESGMKISVGAGRNDFLSPLKAYELKFHQYFFYIQFNGIKKLRSLSPMHKGKCNNQF